MSLDNPDLDQRLSRFEAQLDRFSLALHQWQQQTPAHPESPGPHDIDQRVRTLEQTLDREADALRRLHEDPLKELQAQAATLREICASAATSVNDLDQAESRLAAIQADVHLHLSELSRTLQALVADLRAGTTALSAAAPTAAWPLERIVHLHDQLRRDASDGESPQDAPPSENRAARLLLQPGAAADEQTESSPAGERRDSQRRAWYIGGALAAAAAILLFEIGRASCRERV